jgi:hypothetical protein
VQLVQVAAEYAQITLVLKGALAYGTGRSFQIPDEPHPLKQAKDLESDIDLPPVETEAR